MNQPHIFNNWDIVAAGWYILCASRKIPLGTVKSFTLCGQRIAVFRGTEIGRAHV